MLAANGVETVIQRDDGVTPTPVISHAILVYNRGRTDHLADGIVITPSHNPPEDGGFKYNPLERRPGRYRRDALDPGPGQRLARERQRRGQAGAVRGGVSAATTHQDDFVAALRRRSGERLDMEAIRAGGLKLGVDPLGGAARPVLAADQRRLRPGYRRREPGGSIRPSRS